MATTTVNGRKATGTSWDWRRELRGSKRDAAAALIEMFKDYGLGDLAPKILDFVREGYSSDTISIMLQETPEYKTRFKGNEKRRAAGLPVLTPAEYLAVESSYKQIMESAGLPPTFYDKPEDFTNWIAKDVSPTEIQSRVKSAQALVDSADPTVREQFEKYYTKGDMVAYALDRTRTAEILERRVRAAQFGGAAGQAGLTVTSGLAEQVAEASGEVSRPGIQEAARRESEFGRLGEIYGEEYDDESAVRDVFLGDAAASGTSRRLASQERAAFGGQSGINQTTLGKSRGGGV